MFLLDGSGNVYGLHYDHYSSEAQTAAATYYFAYNAQGDVIGIYDASGTVVATYAYDEWGNCTVQVLAADSNGHAADSPDHIAQVNPFRYRGYFYDDETGLYYLNSRYYDPETCRFLNADGVVQTGQGMLDKNMFAYCSNNPVMHKDPSGQFWISALVVGGLIIAGALLLGGCSAKSESKPEPYNTTDDAARAFSEQVYSSSSYIRHEYSTEIYSRTINGNTTYNYNPPRAGQPHSASVRKSTPKGTTLVAYAHTHPNSNSFSGKDIQVSVRLEINAYVVGPNLELQRYNLSTASTTNLGSISPAPLTDAQRAALVTEFRVSWDEHTAEGCDFGCDTMVWPTP